MAKRTAVIGGGISGITAANVLQRAGHRVVVYDRYDTPGGQWTTAYPGVTLQNTWREYAIPSYPWPFIPHEHPTGEEVRRYFQDAAVALNLDMRLGHEVVSLEELPKSLGWKVRVKDLKKGGDAQGVKELKVGDEAEVSKDLKRSGETEEVKDWKEGDEAQVEKDLKNSGESEEVKEMSTGAPPPGAHPLSGGEAQVVKDLTAGAEAGGPKAEDLKRGGAAQEVKVKDLKVGGEVEEALFDYVIIATGHYCAEKSSTPEIPGREVFKGRVITAREVEDPAKDFGGKRVVVLGFGKTALDMAAFAADHGAREVHHVFRSPRWVIPRRILGVHCSHAFFTRFGTVMMPSWVHPSGFERTLHDTLKPLVAGFWGMMERLLWWQLTRPTALLGVQDSEAKSRLETLKPRQPFSFELRSAVALAPDTYFQSVAHGKIVPHRAEIQRFSETGVELSEFGPGPGPAHVEADVVVLAVGSKPPAFPFLPMRYREMLEGGPGGAQLYRHLVHPRIPNLGFAGFNHGFVHIPTVEVSTVWLAAVLAGKLELPSPEEMERSILRVQEWKQKNALYEPSQLMTVNCRHMQYIDVLLQDLGLSPYRKGWNFLAEVFVRYRAEDYRAVLQHFFGLANQKIVLHPVPLDT